MPVERASAFALGDEPVDDAERVAVRHFDGTSTARCRCGVSITVRGKQEFVRQAMRAFDRHECLRAR